MASKFSFRFGNGLLLMWLIWSLNPARGEFVFESATGTPTTTGVGISSVNWLFHNFEVTSPTQVGDVGVFLRSFDPGQMFAAIVAISNEFDYPDSIDLSTPDLLGTVVIDVPDTGFSGSEIVGPLPLTLDPGWYALGFGTGGFGATPSPTASLSIPSFTNDLAPNELPYSQLQPNHPSFPNQRVWQVATPRFFVQSALPSPDFDHNGLVDGKDLRLWENSFGTTDQGDADGDGDSDGADFLLWQQAFQPPPTSLLDNGDFETGTLSPWTPVVTPNGDVSLGFPRVESFDVDGDGESSNAMRIRVGVDQFDGENAGGGIKQTFLVENAGSYLLTADIAATNIDTIGNTAPGKFELILDGTPLAMVDMNGTLISSGEVLRDSLTGQAFNLSAGAHTLEVLVTRPALNSRKIYQYVDNISVIQTSGFMAYAVPEPTSAVLFGIVLLNLSSRRQGLS